MKTSVFLRKGQKLAPLAMGGLWLAFLGGGSMLLARYENAPGTSGTAPVTWPTDTAVRPATGKSTLVMVAHPKCPCTRASVAELTALLKENPGRISARILFFEPADADASWRQTSTWQDATGVPGLTASADIEGAEAARFGGETSGDVLLFNEQGHLVFHGGITAARGKFGPSAGHSALNDHLSGRSGAPVETPVYGCPIESPAPTPSATQP